MKIAINGFGRIGRLVFRLAQESSLIEIVAINDLVPAYNLAYLLEYDSTHGRYDAHITHSDQEIIVNGKSIPVYAEKNPDKLPWDKLNVDIVVESTGLFKSYEAASLHLKAGAQRVIISAPGNKDVPTYVMGVNHENFNPEKDKVVSNASCTTNCLAPLCKILLDHYGIQEGLMTTVHALTASQPTVDAPSKKDLRSGRSAVKNIIPASTGAAKAVTLTLPELRGKLTGMAFRIPVSNVSVVDLTVKLEKSTGYKDLCQVFQDASKEKFRGILRYCDQPLVSSDFNGDRSSCIFDAQAGIALNDRFFKLIAWYDNEMGYSARIVDLIHYIKGRLPSNHPC